MGTRTSPVTELLRADTEGVLLPLVDAALPCGPTEVDPGTAGRMVRPYTWLVEHVGPDGLRLTGSGYLPPASVAAAAEEFGLRRTWTGSFAREETALPVLVLRESAQQLGLLRRRAGVLRRSVPAARALGDPVALWHLVAEGLPLRSSGEDGGRAGLLLLLAVAAGSDSPYRDVAAGLSALGGSGGTAVTARAAADLCAATAWVLTWTGAIRGNDLLGTLRPTPDGTLLARAALGHLA
ncbi:hypothetical protein [Nocardiopsis algeriensis]|uniref:Uncharacterized protein n=1 Tax=Nocardiopsis algeriensis TaxID=1478215 RepID=A0A841IZE7_9ACTN|nr:hypothetical protein [Nocardiopsis algeriensis]MBB6121825.1 hypothetical protein [Nocardiopsis algeriensis]